MTSHAKRMYCTSIALFCSKPLSNISYLVWSIIVLNTTTYSSSEGRICEAKHVDHRLVICALFKIDKYTYSTNTQTFAVSAIVVVRFKSAWSSSVDVISSISFCWALVFASSSTRPFASRKASPSYKNTESIE